MNCVSRWTVVMVCLAVVLGAVGGVCAQRAAQRSSQTVFERFTTPLGQRQPERLRKGEVEKMFKQRRLILDDDGDYGEYDLDFASGGVEKYLALRFDSTVDTQVETYILCIGGTDFAPARPNPYYAMPQFFYGDAESSTARVIDKTIKAYIKAAREGGMELFGSLRMNDIHDSFMPYTYPLKTERPDLLIGEEHWPGQYPNLLEGEKRYGKGGYPEDSLLTYFFCALDYAEPEVRQYFLRYIDYCCREYDFDGFELDYFRHPLFFKLGEEAQNLDTMTEFVRQVRRLLNQVGKERGRPYVLAIRVPDTPEMALRTGLDVERWLKEGLLDMLVVGGGYMAYAGRLKEFIDMAHHYGVPAYPCINPFGVPIKMRSYASNFWALGGDGVYIFNYSGVGDEPEKAECLNQLGDPDILLGLDKQYVPENGCNIAYCGHINPPGQFPVRLIDGTPIELVVGDDIEKAMREGILEEMRLQVKVSNMDENEGITIKINGAAVPVENTKRVDAETFEAVVTAPPVRRGINQIAVLPGVNSIGRLSSTVTWLELSVRYRHD